jgi:predicted metal-dependent hydrolase
MNMRQQAAEAHLQEAKRRYDIQDWENNISLELRFAEAINIARTADALERIADSMERTARRNGR